MRFVLRKPQIMLIKLVDKSINLISHPNLINIKNNYFYIDIPKCGSSFIKSTIIEEGDSLINLSSSYPHSALFKRPLLINSINEKQIITFVRDPIERFLSVIRQKMMNKEYFKYGWNPSKLPFHSKLFSISKINEFIKELISLPLNQVDKHIIPQVKFLEYYQNHKKIKIFHTSDISRVLLEIGIKNSSFPDKKISLRTDTNLFNISNLNNNAVRLLEDFYVEDYTLLEKLDKEI